MRIEGVTVWTGIDNYEWLTGFDLPFGLFDLDRSPRGMCGFTQALSGWLLIGGRCEALAIPRSACGTPQPAGEAWAGALGRSTSSRATSLHTD